MNRRNFIKGAAGLVALAVAGPTLAKLSLTDRERLLAQARNDRVIENQTFIIDDPEPVVISASNLTIRNCTFLFTRARRGGPCIDLQGRNILIAHCHLEIRGYADHVLRLH